MCKLLSDLQQFRANRDIILVLAIFPWIDIDIYLPPNSFICHQTILMASLKLNRVKCVPAKDKINLKPIIKRPAPDAQFASEGGYLVC